MLAKVRRWGNGLALRVHKDDLETAGIAEGDVVQIELTRRPDRGLDLAPAHRRDAVGERPALPGARPGRRLRARLRGPGARIGHRDAAHAGPGAAGERGRRTAGGHPAPGVLDHAVVVNERHLRALLTEFARFYNQERPHRTLTLEAPVPIVRSTGGAIRASPVLGGLHHVYERAA